jgi:hypothetical protein
VLSVADQIEIVRLEAEEKRLMDRIAKMKLPPAKIPYQKQLDEVVKDLGRYRKRL